MATVLFAFGPNGLILVSSNVVYVSEKYTLVAVPFFVFMANIFEKSGVVRELLNSWPYWVGGCAVAWWYILYLLV